MTTEQVQVSCACGKAYRLSAELIGRKVKCKACGEKIAVEAAGPPRADGRSRGREPAPATPERKVLRARPVGPREAADARDDEQDERPRRPEGRGRRGGPARASGTRRAARPRRGPSKSAAGIIGGVLIVLLAGGLVVAKVVLKGIAHSPSARRALRDGLKESNDWSRFSSSSGRFSVETPGTPVETTEVVPTDAGLMTIHQFAIDRGDVAYICGYWDVPGGVEPGVEDMLLDGAVQGMIADTPGARIEESRSTRVAGCPGRAAKIRASFEGTPAVLEVRLALAPGGRVYQVLYVSEVGAGSTGDAQRFLGSFQLQG